jgi:GT2 family glycosyltransferase
VKVSAVIPALNEEAHVGLLLRDLARSTRPPDETIVVDAGSDDGTVAVVGGFPGVRLLRGDPPVAKGRNRGGFAATGGLIVFLDADVRVGPEFLENVAAEVERRRLDVACPRYLPEEGSSATVRAFHAFFNGLMKAGEGVVPSGAGHCIVVRGDVFRASRGFDPDLKFDDIELVRRLSRGRAFGILHEEVRVSDRRYRQYGTFRTFLSHLLMAPMFALGKFHWANRIEYEFGKHES